MILTITVLCLLCVAAGWFARGFWSQIKERD